MAFLDVIRGPGLQQRIELNLARSLMGRHPSCQIVVDASSVSRQHAQIVWNGKEFSIEDLSSRNGTYVNDQRIKKRQTLGDGDLIKICDFTFRFNHALMQLDSGQTALNDVPRYSSRHIDSRIVDESESDALSKIMSRFEVSKVDSSHSSISAEKRLTTLIEITQALSQAVLLDEVLPKVLDSLFKIFVQAERSFIFLREDGGSVVPRWYLTNNPTEPKENLRVSRTIIDYVLETKQAILSADAAEDHRFDLSQSIVGNHVRSIMCAPIVDNDLNTIGCIQIDTFNQTARFKEEDLEVLATVAMQAGIAIENASLLEEAIEQREVQRDLELAHEVQHSILPRSKPRLTGYDFFDFYRPAQQIGGDYFDYVSLGDNRYAVLVADVVGHGISAALLMAKFSSEARFALAANPDLCEAIAALNDSVESMAFERFITLIVAVIDANRNTATFVNAGHNPPMVRKGSTVTELSPDLSGLPIGVASGSKYSSEEIELAPGDMVTMFTDGVTEAFNTEEEMYSSERLQRLIAEGDVESARKTGRLIVKDLEEFTVGLPFRDDVCLVAFNRTE